MNLFREALNTVSLVAEAWIFGGAFIIARLLTWDDDEGSHPFENQLVPAAEVAIV